jgi:hypothetical protein
MAELEAEVTALRVDASDKDKMIGHCATDIMRPLEARIFILIYALCSFSITLV